MKSINWTRLSEEPENPAAPECAKPQERPSAPRPAFERDELRDTAEHKVLRNIARTYARYDGPQLD